MYLILWDIHIHYYLICIFVFTCLLLFLFYYFVAFSFIILLDKIVIWWQMYRLTDRYQADYYTINVLKFQTLVACQNGQDKQGRLKSDWSSLIRFFSVCYLDKHFVNSSPDNQHFIWEQKEKSVRNLKTYTISLDLVNQGKEPRGA